MQIGHVISLFTTLLWLPNSCKTQLSFLSKALKSLLHRMLPPWDFQLLMLCAHPSACNSLSNLLHLTLPPPSQHSSGGSSHGNLCICLHYHLFYSLVHVKSPTFDCELFKCRNRVLNPLASPPSPFYPWCRHLLNQWWIKPF